MPPTPITVHRKATGEIFCVPDLAQHKITRPNEKNYEIEWKSDANVGEFKIIFHPALDSPSADNEYEKTSSERSILVTVKDHDEARGYFYDVEPVQTSEQKLKGGDPGLIIEP